MTRSFTTAEWEERSQMSGRSNLPTFLSAGALILGVATGAAVVSAIVRRGARSGKPYLPRRSALSRRERRALREAHESGRNIAPVVADIDAAERYDRYSG